MAAEALIPLLLEKLTTAIIDQAGSDLHELRIKLSAIHGVIFEAELHSMTERDVRDWVAKHKDASYRADDLLREFRTYARRRYINYRISMLNVKILVLKLDLHDNKAKQKAMAAVVTFPGIDSISVDMKEQKMTVTGIIDPKYIVSKLSKQWGAEIVSVAQAKEPEKKGEAKKDEAIKDDADKEEDDVAYQSYNPHMTNDCPVQTPFA